LVDVLPFLLGEIAAQAGHCQVGDALPE